MTQHNPSKHSDSNNEALNFHSHEPGSNEPTAKQQRQELAQATGLSDEASLLALQELGYTRETIGILHLVPLVQVAWASGSVTTRERELVLQLAAWRGVRPGSPAWQQLDTWLDKRPAEEFFRTTLRLVRHLLDKQPLRDRVTGRTELINFCIRIATASGGFLGYESNISAEEQQALDQIVEELTKRNPEAVQQVAETI